MRTPIIYHCRFTTPPTEGEQEWFFAEFSDMLSSARTTWSGVADVTVAVHGGKMFVTDSTGKVLMTGGVFAPFIHTRPTHF